MKNLLHAGTEREQIRAADWFLQKMVQANCKAFAAITSLTTICALNSLSADATKEQRRAIKLVKEILPQGIVSNHVNVLSYEQDPGKLKLAALGYFQELLDTNPPAAAALERAALEPLRIEAEVRGLTNVVQVIDGLGDLSPEEESPAPLTERVQ